MDQAGTGDRAGIDHRIERPVVVGQPDRIERLAARLDADRRRHAFFADQFERKRKHESLGDRLDGERHPAVADLVDMAVDGNERDAEMRGIGALQLGNVIGDRAEIVRFEFLVASLQKALERRLVGIAGISGDEIAFGGLANLGVHDHPCKWQETKQSLCHGRLPALDRASGRTQQMCVILTRAAHFLNLRPTCVMVARPGKPALPRCGA